MTQRDDVLAYIRASPGRCDDCIAAWLGIQPRQSVNAARRALEANALVRSASDSCVRCGGTKLCSWPTTAAAPEPSPSLLKRPRKARETKARLADGVAALEQILERAGFPSLTHAVAAHTVFLHPDTVAQTGGQALFPVVRAPLNTPRRRVVDHADGRRVWADDNGPPTSAFLWAADLRRGRDVQFNHVWQSADDPDTYTALWNLCVTPAFLAKTTDTHPEVTACLRYRAFDLYGHLPTGTSTPDRPASYDELTWAAPPAALPDLERHLRQTMATKPKNSTVRASRELGWLFSDWKPDPTLPE